ncbi:MAG: hypothetical protein ABSB35_03415 [Bryobacteraceae bacterium]
MVGSILDFSEGVVGSCGQREQSEGYLVLAVMVMVRVRYPSLTTAPVVETGWKLPKYRPGFPDRFGSILAAKVFDINSKRRRPERQGHLEAGCIGEFFALHAERKINETALEIEALWQPSNQPLYQLS